MVLCNGPGVPVPSERTRLNSEDGADALADPLDTVLRSLTEMWRDFLRSIPNLAIATLVLVGTWLVATLATKALSSVLRRSRLRGSLRDLFTQLLYAAVWVAGLLLAAVVLFPGITPGKILTVLGLGSIAIGFAFKDIFENFFAGVLILWRFPFEKGDIIEVGDVTGRVESVSIRMTNVVEPDGRLIVLPNAKLFKEPVTVLTHQPLRRARVVCGVAYGADVEQARDVIRDAVGRCDTVSDTKEFEVRTLELGASSVDFEVLWWTGSELREMRKSRDEVVTAIKRALDDAGIEIPFPQRTLTFADPLPIQHDRSAAEAMAGNES